jgi:hypothetical protein
LLHGNPTISEINLLDQNTEDDGKMIFDVDKEFFAIAMTSGLDGKIRHSP